LKQSETKGQNKNDAKLRGLYLSLL
jgi:hypothetical protein